MAKQWLPRDDTGFSEFVGNFSKILSRDPAVCMLTSADAERYAVATADFLDKLRIARSYVTRGPMTVAAKDASRAELEALTRQFAGILRRSPEMTASLLTEFRLQPAKARAARPGSTRPTEAPVVRVTSTRGGALELTLVPGKAGRLAAKPESAAGATILMWVGTGSPPAKVSGWQFLRNTGQPKVRIEFAYDWPPGTAVWLTAQWFGPTFEPGPHATPVCGYVGFGDLRIAA